MAPLTQRQANKAAVQMALQMITGADLYEVFGDDVIDSTDENILDKAQKYAVRRVRTLVGEPTQNS